MPARRFLESLESRTLMAVALGANLLVNGDAEAGPASSTGDSVSSIPGWIDLSGTPLGTVVPYGASGFISESAPGPGKRGENFFAGGKNESASLVQTVDVSSVAADIDAGRIKMNFSGWVGGFGNETDAVAVSFYFNPVNVASLGPVQPERNGVTRLDFVTLSETIPARTRTITIRLDFNRDVGTNNDGYADNLTLKLTSTLAGKGRIAGTAKKDLDGDGKVDSGEGNFKGAKVFIDKDKDGKLDSGESSVTSDSKGKYAFENLAPGKYVVRTILPSTYRATTTNPQSLSVSAGLTTSSEILLSQTSVITGAAWNDDNDNDRRDSSDSVFKSVYFFLDFNDNDVLDSFEPQARTSDKGVYKFVVPHGRYLLKPLDLTLPEPAAWPEAPVLSVSTSKGQIKSIDYKVPPV